MSERLDERLRRAARTYRRLGNHTAEGMFLEAADTICELQAENAKLQEQIHWLKHGDILHVLTDQEYIDQCERERLMQVSIDALDKENAKLRERVEELEELLPENGRWFSTEVVEAYIAEIKKLRELVDYMTPIALYGASEQERDRMRELGVEVD